MSSTFRVPQRIAFGWGALADLGKLAASLGGRVLLVTGRRAMKAAGITDRAMDALRDAGAEVRLFDEVEREPEVATVDRGREAARKFAAECVVGLGGGSAMDAAKVIAGLYHEQPTTAEFHAGRAATNPGLPMIAVATTSGTGSEATVNGVISDRARHVKVSIRGEHLMPHVALVDPELTVPCPADVTASAGMDALCQAIESYASIHATAITEALSVRAVEEIVASLETAVHRPDDRDARTRMAQGSLMAGMALGNARLGVIHGIVHPLGVRYEIPHGLACGVMLPAALRYNRQAMGDKYETLRSLLGGVDPAEFCAGLLERVGLPSDFRSFGVPQDDFGTIADESLPSGSLKANPRRVTREDVLGLLREVC
ncbi:MAG: iron-containing alcohol dehydrogenase [Planctomycetes bacterium]|nr:iron-containing alcohol dehydrogenase [Planctomycetota bacterium]